MSANCTVEINFETFSIFTTVAYNWSPCFDLKMQYISYHALFGNYNVDAA